MCSCALFPCILKSFEAESPYLAKKEGNEIMWCSKTVYKTQEFAKTYFNQENFENFEVFYKVVDLHNL